MSVLQSKRRAVINEPHKATSSGAVVQMDKAEYAPMGVVANFTPVQDLHGQSSPYPAGGGKNKYYYDSNNASVETTTTQATRAVYHTGITSGGTFTLSGYIIDSASVTTSSINVGKFVGGEAELITSFIGSSSITFRTVTLNEGEELILLAAAESVAAITLNLPKYNIQIEAGSEATDYAPYSNICPISGWTGCNVYDDSKYGGLVDWNQIIDIPSTNKTVQGNGANIIDNRDGTYTVYTSATGVTSQTASNLISFSYQANHVYLIHGVPESITDTNTAFLYSSAIGGISGQGKIIRLTGTSSNALQIIVKKDSIITDHLTFRPMIHDLTDIYGAGNEPTTVAEFEERYYKDYYPYNAGQLMTVGQVNGEPYRAVNVDWTDTAGTVYGGSLDVASGVLTAKWANIASYNGETLSGRWLSDRDVYVAGTTPTTGAQVCYELATPITYTLTPTQIKSLRGKNNVWTDMNAPTDVSAWVH